MTKETYSMVCLVILSFSVGLSVGVLIIKFFKL